MAGVVASKVRKQRAKDALNLKGDGDDEARKKQAKIPVGPGGVRQLPQQNSRRRNRALHQNPDGSFESGGSANVILYVGLGMISVGLVITFVGLGEKGFKTLELKLIGPSLVGCGVFFALLRVLFCTVPSCCRSCMKTFRKTEDAEKLLKAELGGQDKTIANLDRGGVKRNGAVGPPPPRSTHRRIEARHSLPPPQHSQPRQTRVASDSEEEPEPAAVRPRIKPVRQKGRQRSEIGDNHSTNSTSSNFSIVDDLARGHPPDLRAGEIILNATRLSVTPT